MKLIDRAGLRFGRLVVLRKDQTPRMWLCRCDCGTEVLVTGSNLSNGCTRSCGCLALEWARELGATPEFIQKRAERVTKHGQKRRTGASIEYKTWLAMKRRCYDTRCKDYPGWGGRGITVCDRWRNDFRAFLADMGPRPADKDSIDRIEGTKGYEPGNCRWATPQEQGETKTSNHRVHFRGVDYCSLRDACQRLGLRYTTVFQRTKSGYSIEQALAFGNDKPPIGRTRESYLRKSSR